MIYSFRRLAKDRELLAGGKGRTLARLYRAGYPVPDGFIVLPSAFADDDLTTEAWALAQTHLARLRGDSKGGAFAVRSSALSEDSARASFAGEFETVLDARTDEDVRQAIHVVRRSRHGDRVRAYSRAQGLAETEHEMAVIVQRMIDADYSGVLFTVDPITGDLTRMTGNFVSGSGEKLVSGQANSAAFTLARPGGKYDGPSELRGLAGALNRNALRLEKELGGPQDIEWATAGGRLYILQSRPITTLVGYKPETGEWNDSLRGNFLWSATNLTENAPYVLTPFSCSLRQGIVYEGVDFGDGSSIGVDGVPMAGIIGGRGYMNLSAQVSVSRPFYGGNTRKALLQATAFWGGVPEDLEVPLVPISTWTWWTRVLPRLTRLGMQMNRLRGKAPAFIAETPRWSVATSQRVKQAATGAELTALWRDEIAPYTIRAFFLTISSATDLPNRLELELRDLVGADDASALLSNLGGLSAQLESLGPMTGLGKVARGEMTREAYLAAYGHRGVNETEYAWPRPLEDPDWMDRQLVEFAKGTVDVESLLAKQRSAYAAAWERFGGRYPRKVNSMRVRLEKAAWAANLREAVRSEATRSTIVIRAFALRAGELIGLGEDVFFLTMDEVLALLAGDDSARRFVAARKETHRRYSALPTYPTIIVGRFDPFAWAADPNRRGDIFNANAPAVAYDSDGGGAITGSPGSVGVVEGTVRRLDRLEDSGSLLEGEILVAASTNIGWTPLFPRAAAIVTDLGAPLSHAAIVARELGIPAVVGCGDATMRLRTGDRVRVNGGKGLVEVLVSAPRVR